MSAGETFGASSAVGSRTRTLLVLGAALASACDSPPPCPENAGWTPTTETSTLYDQESATWTATSGTLEETTEGCENAPCLSLVAGSASFSPSLNRAETYHLAGRIQTTGASLSIGETGDAGSVVALGGQEFSGGDWSDIDISFTPEKGESSIAVTLTTTGTVVLDDFALTAEVWAESEEAPSGAPVELAFLIHIEEEGFRQDEVGFRRRARVIEALDEVFMRHDARLTVQPDESFLNGIATWQPDWMVQRTAEGAGWSVHLHDDGGEGTAVATSRQAYQYLGFEITDVNGGFGNAPWETMAGVGALSLTGYKDPRTQLGLPDAYSHPWRPPEGATAAEDFVRGDPEGPLLYLPGYPKREAVHSRLGEAVRRSMSQVLVHADDSALNTWYFLLHVDDFPNGTDDEATVDAYLAGEGFEADLAWYEALFGDVLDPLVADGLVHYSVPMEMAAAAEAICR